MNCLMRAWHGNEGELRGWLRRHLGNAVDAEDALQELFLKSLRQKERFCEIANARAWLFEVARNALADRLRQALGAEHVKPQLDRGRDLVDVLPARA